MGQGPLAGIKIVEFAGIGPGPYCAMVLSDLGAEVIRLDRTAAIKTPRRDPGFETTHRGRRNVAVDLKQPDAVELALQLVEKADGIIEGFRPGVMERLGLGPDVCLARNPRLVYGRMTGWGQVGPLAQAAGHDINYIALTGALHAIGRKGEAPVPPLNLVGDFGGGGLLLAFGMLAAFVERQASGKGQVVDAAMVDGAANLMMMFFGQFAGGQFRDERGTNVLDTGAHYYNTYETKDGKYVCLGSIEPQFYALLLKLSGLEGDPDLPHQQDRDQWPAMQERLRGIFRTKTRAEWCAIMEGTDVCFAPVLSLSEAPQHPQAKARDAFIELGGIVQPAPAPRFSRTPGKVERPPSRPGQHTREALAGWGIAAAAIARLEASGAIAQA